MKSNLAGKAEQDRSLLGGINISVRIAALVVFALLAVVAMGGIFLFGQQLLSKKLADEGSYLDIQLGVLQAEVDVLMLRRREKDFLLRMDLKYLNEFLADHDKAVKGLESIRQKPLLGQKRDVLDSVLSKLEKYKRQFEKVVTNYVDLGLSEKEGLKGSLRDAVHGVETKLKVANLDALTVKMLMMRRHEKDFMLRGAEKYLGSIKERRQEFDPMLAATDLPNDDKAEITTLMDRYQSDIQAFGEKSLSLEPEVKSLSAIYVEMAESLTELVEFASEGLNNSRQDALLTEEKTTLVSLIAAIIGILGIAVAGFVLMRSISRPIGALTNATERLASNDLAVKIPVVGNKDELGAMARALLVFKQSLVEMERLRNEREEEVTKAEEDRKRDRDRLASSFDSKVGSIVNAVSAAAESMYSNAEGMSQSSQQTRSQADAVASAAQGAAGNVQTVASAAEELSASINEITQQVAHSSKIAGDAVAEAEKTNQQVLGLAEAAQKIDAVVALIAEIAEQTNLLALNATIEAARAGESGKGFAVVASEVKSLASQTAKATEEISMHISNIQTEAREAVDAIGGISKTIGTIDEIVSNIAISIDRQSSATREIAANIQQAASGTQEVTANIKGVTSASSFNSETAEKLLGASGNLSEQAEMLRKEVGLFLDDVRVA